MVHNGIEYGMMAAYAEGLNILKHAGIGKDSAYCRRRDDPAARSVGVSYDLDLPDIAEVWRRGSVIASWLLDLTAAALAADPGAREIPGTRLRFRRRAVDARSGHRRGRTGERARRVAVLALHFPRRGRLPEPPPVGHAIGVRWARGAGRQDLRGSALTER